MGRVAKPRARRKLFSRDPVLGDRHRLDRRPDERVRGQPLERLGRDVLELGRDRGARGRQLVQRARVGVGGAQVDVGHAAGRAAGIGVEHHHAVAHRPRAQREHPAELAAAQHADGGAGQDHAELRQLEGEHALGLRGAQRVEPPGERGSASARMAAA